MRADVLLVSDDAETGMIARSLGSSQYLRRVTCLASAAEALEYLGGVPMAPDGAGTPALVVLSLAAGGVQVVNAIRRDPRLRLVPVVALGQHDGSESAEDLYRAGCNSYVCLAADPAAHVAALDQVVAYWLGLNLLPFMR